jgi:ankyrin repeat protein
MNKTQEFFQAIQAGDVPTVKSLLDAEPSLASAQNDGKQSAVLFAVYNGRKEIRDLLIARGLQLALHEAAAAGQLDRVRELVDADASLAKSSSPDGFPVLALAAVFGHQDVAEYLFAKGAEENAAATNGSGYTALTGAVASGHKSMAAWLMAHGADVNHRYGPGFSPLLTAAANGHREIAEMLLAHGADLHAQTSDGKNALSFATERGHTAVADFLRARGL